MTRRLRPTNFSPFQQDRPHWPNWLFLSFAMLVSTALLLGAPATNNRAVPAILAQAHAQGTPAEPGSATVGMPITLVVQHGEQPTRRTTSVLLSGTTMLAPLDDITAAVGAESARSGQMVTIRLAERNLQFQAADRKAIANGTETLLSAAPVEMNGTLFVPLAAVADALGWTFRWDAQSNELRLSIRDTLPTKPSPEVHSTAERSVPDKPAIQKTAAQNPTAQRQPTDSKPTASKGAEPPPSDPQGSKGTSPTSATPAAKAAVRIQITGLRLSQQDERAVVEIQGTGPLTWKTSLLRWPDRLVVDLPGAAVAKTAKSLPGDGTGLRGVRIAQYTPEIARVVVDLNQPIPYEVKAVSNGTVLSVILRSGRAPAAPEPKLPPATTVSAQASDVQQPNTSPPDRSAQLADATDETQPSSVATEILATLGVSGVAEAAGRPGLPAPAGEASRDPGGAIGPGGSVSPGRPGQFPIEPTPGRPTPPATPPPANRPEPGCVPPTFPPPLQGQIVFPPRVAGQAAGAVVIIDPGHGGRDPGAVSPKGTMEKNLTLAISLKVAQLLSEQGVQVLLTRDRDVCVDKPDRARFANMALADALLSIHLNSTGSAGAPEGTETLYLGRRPENAVLAKFIQDAVVGSLGLRNRGLKQRTDLYLLKYSEVPTALVEVAFLNGAQEEERLLDEAFQLEAATAIRDGLLAFLRWQPTER